MRFEGAYRVWQKGRLTESEAAEVIEIYDLTFCRYLSRYEAEGVDGFTDKRLRQGSPRRAPVYEVMEMTQGYQRKHEGGFLPNRQL